MRFAVTALRAAGVLAVLTVVLLLAAAPLADAAPPRDLPADWMSKVRADHPRLFFNKETWPAVKAYTLAHEKDYYEKIKRRVAAAPARPDAKRCEGGSNTLYGPIAQMAAFVWRMEGDRDALARAKTYLAEAVAFYNRRSSAKQAVNWYSASRVCAMTAYDWIHDELSPEERSEIGQGFFKHYKDCLSGRSFPRQNRSDHTSGFYGPTNMAWYVGLAFHKDGIDDAEAARLLKKGYEEHLRLLEYRAEAAGDDGGAGSLATGYAFGMYPWAEYNFMHTYSSATGLAMEKHFDHMSLMANWVFWNRLPGHMRWGLADSVPAGAFHDAFLEMHLLQAAHFYAREYPDRAGFALWVRSNILKSREHDDYWWPVAPLFLTRCAELPEPKGPDASWPLARNFEKMGLVTMRSDWTDDATCAAIVSGGDIASHRHYDQGHFIIYRRGGYLAIDSGDYGPRERNEHLTEYLYRTVAHNSLLIHAPESADKPPKVWGGEARTLDGGQCRQAGRQIAFETHSAYSYVAIDMTACYAETKCKNAVRQFLFVHPDTFVICDRVTAVKPEYRKVWLLHTVTESTISQDGRSFHAEHGESSLTGFVAWPGNAKIAKVGGAGKEFFSAGKNRPQEGKHKELAGAWRVEASPGEARTDDVFVHVLRVGDKPMAARPEVKATQAGDQLKVEFATSAGQPATVTFNTAGPVGGLIVLGGRSPVNRALATTVARQSGIGFAGR